MNSPEWYLSGHQLVEIIPYAGLQFGTYSALKGAAARWNAAEARHHANHVPRLKVTGPCPPVLLRLLLPAAALPP